MKVIVPLELHEVEFGSFFILISARVFLVGWSAAGIGLAALDTSVKSPECLQECKPFRVDEEMCL